MQKLSRLTPSTGRQHAWWLHVCLLLLLFCTPAAYALPTIDLTPQQHTVLRAPVEFVETSATTSLETVQTLQFAPLTHADLSQGVTERAFWLRLRLNNPADEAHTWVLHHESAYLDRLNIWLADAGSDTFRETALTDRAPYATRELDYRRLGVLHTTPANSHTDVYLRLSFDKADAMLLSFELWDEARFLSGSAHQNLLHGAYYGAILALLLLALLVALVLRQKLYLHYAGFLASSVVLWAILNGHVLGNVAPNAVALHNEGLHVAFLLMTITALQFSRGFLLTAEWAPRIDRALKVVSWVLVGGIVLRLLGVWSAALWLSYAGLMVLMLLPVLGLAAWRRGQQYARWYAFAWLVYSFGIAFSLISAVTTLLDTGLKPLAFTQGASLLEAVMLLFALTERLTAWERDRRHALELAHLDPLTGLGNRRRLLHAFEEFRERFAHTREPVFALMLDLDHFKQVNDRFGHDAGDVVLREMAELLREHCRPGDVCIRYGGEEFAVLLQAPSLDKATDIAERIRQAFARSVTRHGNHEIPHTLSAGVAEVLSENVTLEAAEMLQRADHALYQAKAGGRNRTVQFIAQAPMAEHGA